MEFEFHKNKTVPKDSFDKVPSDFRGLYKEDGDNMVLDSDHAGVKAAVGAITGISSALAKERGINKELRSKTEVDLSPLSEYGSTIDEINDGIKDKIKEIEKSAKKGGDDEVERRVKAATGELKRGHDAEVTALKTQLEARTGQLHKTLISSATSSALASAKALHPDVLLPHLAQHIRVKENDDGEHSLSVVDENGEQRYDGTGQPLSVAGLVEEFKGKEAFQSLFSSETKSGGGRQTTQTRQTTGKGGEKSSLEKISSGLEKEFGIK